jgi:hypothetical protein
MVFLFPVLFFLGLSLLLVRRIRALVETALHGLENLENLVRELFFERSSGPSSARNLRREVRGENTEEANRN